MYFIAMLKLEQTAVGKDKMSEYPACLAWKKKYWLLIPVLILPYNIESA